MSENQLSVPGVIINNETILIVPNSLVYDGGEGEVSVRAASAGGKSSDTVHAVNAESFFSRVMFDVFLTSDLDRKIAEWKNAPGNNSIEIHQRPIGGGDAVTLSFAGCSLTNQVERNASADGVVSLEWHGDPMTAQ